MISTRQPAIRSLAGVALGLAVLLPSTAALAAPVAAPPAPKCTITGSAGSDILNGTAGNDVICGLAGNDRINGLGGNDTIIGGTGNDTITGGPGTDTINAGTGNDMVNAGTGNDTIAGEAGNDTIAGAVGNDTANGGAGNDRIDGGEGTDTLAGEAGKDTLMGNTGDDSLNGGPQADTLVGGTGKDRIAAGTPGDICAQDAFDPITGTCGTDTIGPEISDVTLPRVVNAGDTITVTWRVTDDSGIDSLGVGPMGGVGPNTRATLTGTPGFVYWDGCSLEVSRISGSSTDGVYQASCAVPAAAPNATYSFMIGAADIFGNPLPGYTRFFDFEVQNGSTDYDAPSVSYNGGLADSYRAGDDVTFTLRGTDETAVAGIGVFVLGPNGRLVDDESRGWIDASDTRRTSGTAQDGTYTVSIKLAATAVPGEYTFLLGYSDTIGNRAWNSAATAESPSITVVA